MPFKLINLYSTIYLLFSEIICDVTGWVYWLNKPKVSTQIDIIYVVISHIYIYIYIYPFKLKDSNTFKCVY